MPVAARRRFTADEYQRMGQTGILCRTDRVELIDGEVLAMTPIGPRHAATVDKVTRLLVTRAGDAAIVRVQSTVRLDLYSEPEPDVVLLRPRDDFYASAHPGPADILLVLEVAESSFDYDRTVKAPLYARAGVAEYWLIDLNEDVVHVHRAPRDGAYRLVQRRVPGDVLTPLLLPALALSTADLLAV